jgi:hypothetical protein
MEETTVLFRPVGESEPRLIAESGYRAFPPRLPGQPIFYPVLNKEYATQNCAGLERERLKLEVWICHSLRC